ncbi:lactosylceramide alpha-2,3-sialyltransferase isoform X9 [Paralichthys olivaceus]|uniref:lactosylceramide alpha-2,3-sialyltransferase isoform X9 n=1 Tax=Paralichthys olivaceus TaxID=8255 RepID=UPI0037503276
MYRFKDKHLLQLLYRCINCWILSSKDLKCLFLVSVLGFLFLVRFSLPLNRTQTTKPLNWHVSGPHKRLENSHSAQPSDKCRHCVVVGNGGILRGLELGPLIDRYDTIIRLNSGPLGEFSVDVGNRTSIRMSYPESTPLHWVDTDPHTLFVAVVYKSVDVSWLSAMINKHAVSLWNRLFFWQKVPNQIPLEPRSLRLLNPHVIRETAIDLLKYPPPRPRLLGWDQNVPTLGVSALNLASLLCDEVSLAGFGYNLSQQAASLHYYDHLPMSAMLHQKMHNVDRETEFLQSLVRDGTITDLTGGIHCSFCSS